MIDTARHAERLIVDEVHFQAANAGIGAGAGDLCLEVFFELEGSGRLPRLGVTCNLVSDICGGGSGRRNLILGQAVRVSQHSWAGATGTSLASLYVLRLWRLDWV